MRFSCRLLAARTFLRISAQYLEYYFLYSTFSSDPTKSGSPSRSAFDCFLRLGFFVVYSCYFSFSNNSYLFAFLSRWIYVFSGMAFICLCIFKRGVLNRLLTYLSSYYLLSSFSLPGLAPPELPWLESIECPLDSSMPFLNIF